ncbi:hypothetical protein HMPREF9371_2420 [Neisseria shayeganii 871]|uniref:Uncharacterized protein n=1 Tax=Neisseria shayeganii 871 TaxID=1032488 RepID=G4CLC9_9NEIS|nr:hypothetical protein HMPREF9371_2420 [Neisseria shayeganii 871]
MVAIDAIKRQTRFQPDCGRAIIRLLKLKETKSGGLRLMPPVHNRRECLPL